MAELAEEDRAAIARVPFDEAAYLAENGAQALAGEPGHSTREGLWARLTLDVNGLTGGYQGAGTETVLPAQASARITCRLVANQDPDRIFDLIEARVAAHCPPGATADATRLQGSTDPFLVLAWHKPSAVAREVLAEVHGREPCETRLGGSIPVMAVFQKELGVHGVMFGFSVGDENLHAPNEFFRLANLEKGQQAYFRLLEKLRG